MNSESSEVTFLGFLLVFESLLLGSLQCPVGLLSTRFYFLLPVRFGQGEGQARSTVRVRTGSLRVAFTLKGRSCSAT